MSSLPNREDQHLQELLAGKVLGDLSLEELQEFGELFSATHSKDLQELEQAAAALQLALVDASKLAMPDSLRQRIADASGSLVSPDSNQFSKSSRTEFQAARASDEASFTQRQGSRFALREGIAWLAVAASLFIATQLWLASDSRKQPTGQLPTAAESRLAMLSEAQDLIRVDWSQGKTPLENSVSGDVVWSNSGQQGFMRFVGMPANDPSKEQYQLWIIDPERDAEPIDGGVFDIASTGEVIVPIQAKLKVLKPAAFAITIEQPGGVVVSTQERLPLLAQVMK
jgi:anti-sigma-K factor RskA